MDTARTTESDSSDTELHSTNAAAGQLPPAAELDEDAADVNFCDGPRAAAAAVAGHDERE